MSEDLEQLARAYGIAPEYRDIWGTQHRAGTRTLRALLAAMGVVAQTEADVAHALAALAQAQRRSFPPALVVRAGQRIVLRVNPTSGRFEGEVHWRLAEEGGAEHAGTLVSRPEEQGHADGYAGAARTLEFALSHEPPPGYHRVTLAGEGVQEDMLLIVAPESCFRPRALEHGGRLWGASIQLYGLRSERNWGIGDFSDLATVAEQWTARGASLVAVNPLHALFPHNPAHASPYSPSSRLFLNVLYIDVDAVEDFRESPEARRLAASPDFREALAKARGVELVDYAAVGRLKSRALELAFEHFRTAHLGAGGARAAAFGAFCAAGGEALERQARFEALQEQFFARDASIHGWQAWPEPFRDPASTEVERFSTEHSERVRFYQYLQWQASLQIATVAQRMREHGAAIGLYADLAVSIDRSGAEAWAEQQSYAVGASVGAPPDEFNLRGQDWGLPPLIPARLREAEYAPFIAMLRANMRNAAALRIDHVMGLKRLFWIPQGAEPREGAYVNYPFEDLLGILALESQRHRCLIVGEDLGTVPEELREALARAGVLSTRLLPFEREPSGEFAPAAAYPAQAIVAASSHDLPTLAGWWEGSDLKLREKLGLFPDASARDRQIAARGEDRARLLRALAREGLLPEGIAAEPSSTPQISSALALAVHTFLARTPAQLMLVQLEDVIGVREQANLPATTDSHPNWRRKLPVALERWPAGRRFAKLAATLAGERPAR